MVKSNPHNFFINMVFPHLKNLRAAYIVMALQSAKEFWLTLFFDPSNRVLLLEWRLRRNQYRQNPKHLFQLLYNLT